MERRLAVHARAPRRVIAAVVAVTAIAALSPVALGAPRSKPAKVAFSRGVTAYQQGNFAVASDALATSYELEPDPETLYAWAQSERQLERCEHANELFRRLLEFDLPTANQRAVRIKIGECDAILAAREPPPREPAPRPSPTRTPAPVATPDEPAPAPAPRTRHRPWYTDALGDTLTGLGLVGLGVGGYYALSARSAESDADAAPNYYRYQELQDRAASRGQTAVIAGIAGGALVVGGLIRYATRSSGAPESATQVTGWVDPTSAAGGVIALGRF